MLFLYFPRYNNVYPTPLHIVRAIKRWLPMKSQTLSFETIVNELDFLKKAVIIQGNAQKKDLILVANKLIEKVKVPFPGNAKKHD